MTESFLPIYFIIHFVVVLFILYSLRYVFSSSYFFFDRHTSYYHTILVCIFLCQYKRIANHTFTYHTENWTTNKKLLPATLFFSSCCEYNIHTKCEQSQYKAVWVVVMNTVCVYNTIYHERKLCRLKKRTKTYNFTQLLMKVHTLRA